MNLEGGRWPTDRELACGRDIDCRARITCWETDAYLFTLNGTEKAPLE